MSAKKKEAGANGEHHIPDSTTRPSFYIGDEVLMQRKDGNYYLGTIIKIDFQKEQGMIKFGDNTESWSSFSRLTKLSTGHEVTCVKCKLSGGEPHNDVIICDRCSRGYHQLCHQPNIKREDLKSDTRWECYRCLDLPKRQLPLRKSTSQVTLPVPQLPCVIPVAPNTTPPSNVANDVQRKKLPYNLSELQWDMQHRINTDNKYCYCGGPGKWFLQMLQCGRCRQWFHARCILALRLPLIFGDRFYIFVCSVCNAGKEFLRRLEVKWIDLVHLAIFNLTLKTAKKYQDVDDLINFINSNWNNFQLPPKILETNIVDRREQVMSVLTGNRVRFKCTREIKKRMTMWGLTMRLPPPTPMFSLPPNKPLTDQILLEAWSANSRPKFLPSQPSHLLPCKNYDFYPDWEKNESSLPGLDLLHIEVNPVLLPVGAPATGHKVCIKSSSPCYPESRAQIERRIKAQSLENDRLRNFKLKKARKHSDEKSPKDGQELPPTPPSSESNPEGASVLQCCDTSGDESSSRGTLDSIIPPPLDFDGRNNPFGGGGGGGGLGSGVLPVVGMPAGAVPMGGVTPILRPTKRRLSEKDIRITSNGEVKRRRVRRVQPGKLGVRGGSLTNDNNIRRLKRQLKSMTTPSTPTVSPIKNGNGASGLPSSAAAGGGGTAGGGSFQLFNVEDLKSSVSHYFGASNRIESGEKFTIRARRILPNGKTQYLIDWGCSSS